MPVILLLFLLLFPARPVLATPDLFSFAESLVAEEDYYRAITEYKRFLHYYPQDPRVPRAQLAIARSLIAGKRWPQADIALEKTWQLYPDSRQAEEAHKLYASVAFERKDFAEARRRYQRLKRLPDSDTDMADYQIGLSYLEENRMEAAEQSFAKLNATAAADLHQTLDAYRRLPRKSPRLAGTLSALLPGAGQLYTERPQQAAIAFALNAAFIYGAVEAWNNENYTVAGILALFEVGWYGGNIYNAVNNAHKHNRELENQFKERFKLSLGFLDKAPWLQAQYRF